MSAKRFLIIAALLPHIAAQHAFSQDYKPNDLIEDRATLMGIAGQIQERVKQESSAVAISEGKIPSSLPDTVWVHLKGKEGKELKFGEEIPKGVTLPPEKIAELNASIAALVQPLPSPYPTPAPIAIRKCAESKTSRTIERQLVSKMHGKEQTVLFDMLFVSKEQEIPYEENAFGHSPIVTYVDDTQGFSSNIAKSYGVSCLPYRKRLVGSTLYEHFGTDAILDYDKLTNGKGQLSVVAAARFGLPLPKLSKKDATEAELKKP